MKIDLSFDPLVTRSIEYPPLTELADAVYWQNKGDPSKMEIYLAKCDEVKQRNPKTNNLVI